MHLNGLFYFKYKMSIDDWPMMWFKTTKITTEKCTFQLIIYVLDTLLLPAVLFDRKKLILIKFSWDLIVELRPPVCVWFTAFELGFFNDFTFWFLISIINPLNFFFSYFFPSFNVIIITLIIFNTKKIRNFFFISNQFFIVLKLKFREKIKSEISWNDRN